MSEHFSSPSSTSSNGYAHFLAALDDAAFWDYAVSLASPLPASPLPEPDFLLCSLDHLSCLLPIDHLCEILSAPSHYTSLPLYPSWMLGVIAWREEFVPVLDLSAYFLHFPARRRREDTLLIIEHEARFIGCLISAVEALPASLVRSDPQAPVQKGWEDFLSSGLIDTVFGNLPLLNVEHLLQKVIQEIEVPPAHE